MVLLSLSLATRTCSVELFRYRGAAKDGGTLEDVFEAGEQNSSQRYYWRIEFPAEALPTFEHQVGHKLFQRFLLEEIYGGGHWRKLLATLISVVMLLVPYGFVRVKIQWPVVQAADTTPRDDDCRSINLTL